MAFAAALTWLARNIELDDALIYQRYVRNALDGLGLVFNPGERFNGLTSPLHTYLSLAFSWPFDDARRGTVLLALLLNPLAVWLALRSFRSSLGEAGTAWAAWMLATSPFLYLTFGMESPLYLALLGSCLALHLAGLTGWLGLVSALLLLTRAEGVLLLAVLGIDHIRRQRPWPRVRFLIAPALVLTSAFSFNFFYYGHPLPQTARAKIDQGRSGLWGDRWDFLDVAYHHDWFFGGSWPLVLAVLGLAALGAWALRRQAAITLWTAFLLLDTAFFVALGIPSYHWYYAPHYLTLFVLAAAGIVVLARLAAARPSQAARTAALGGVAAIAIVLPSYQLGLSYDRASAARGDSAYHRIGRWLQANTEPSARVAAVEVGVLGWTSERPIIDILGLVSPYNSRLLGEGRLSGWLQHYELDYAVAHVPAWPSEIGIVQEAARGRLGRVFAVDAPGFALYRRSGRSPSAPIARILTGLRRGRRSDHETVARAILDEKLYDPIPIGGPDMLAVNVFADGWTRGRAAAGLAVANRQAEPVDVRVRLAPATDGGALQTAVIDDGKRRLRHSFDGLLVAQIKLGSIEPGEAQLLIIWSDRAWTPGPQDPRKLGVNLLPPE